MQRTTNVWGIFLVVTLLGAACIPTKRLEKNENYLYKLEFEGVGGARAETLETFSRQTPNRRFPLIPALPYVYFYNRGKRIYDRSYPTQAALDSTIRAEKKVIENDYQQEIEDLEDGKARDQRKKQRLLEKRNRKTEDLEDLRKGNWLMRTVGEPPSIFDSLKAKQDIESMEQYLTQKGYFFAEVDTTMRKKGRRVFLTFEVKKNKPHHYRKINYDIADSLVKKIVLSDTLNRLIKPNAIYDEDRLSAERERLFSLLRNRGYFKFSKQYIFFEIDTLASVPDYQMDLTIVIEKQHQQYHLDRVRFIADQQRDTTKLKREEYAGIYFKEYTRRYSEKVLSHRIHLDSIYSYQEGISTQRSLAALDLFKFVNIRYDTTGGDFVGNIYVNSYPKFNLSLEAGINVTQQATPGPFVTLSFQNRNLFHGCEILTVQARGLLEAQGNFGGIENQNLYAQEYNISTNLSIPKFFLPFAKKLNEGYGKFNPRTKIEIGYTQTNRVLYNRINSEASIGYTWNNNRNATYDFEVVSINSVLTPSISDVFSAYLDSLSARGNPLNQSFRNSIIRSTAFSYTFNDNLYGQKEGSYFLKATLEQGGTEVRRLLFNSPGVGDLLGQLINSDSLADFNYFRFDIDLRRVLRLSRKSMLAMRARIGAVYPFGRGATADILPYEKYFFIGGGNSIRAWQPRRLGPGGFRSPTERGSHPFDYLFEQPGELLLELNAEWRRDLFSVAEFAFFVDSGNVWMFNDDSRQGGQFRWERFWQQIAIGSGFGLRLDFSFFIVRGDVGIKIYDPAGQTGDKWLLDNISFRKPLGQRGQSVFNLAIGYPF